MNAGRDFSGLALFLVGKALALLQEWLSAGKLQGKEFVCGNLRGEPGSSLSINILTGQWSDFSTGEKGGDLTSLYAAIHGITQAEAYDRLARDYGFDAQDATRGAASNRLREGGQSLQSHVRRELPAGSSVALSPPPEGEYPDTYQASAVYDYRDASGRLLYVVTRVESDGGKSFRPYSWQDGVGWVNKSWPAPRPLFGLELLGQADRPVLLVEGEKAAIAARAFASSRYHVLTWPNGANSWNKTDWEPLRGRNVLLWPDHDPAGYKAMEGVAEKLHSIGCKVRQLDLSSCDVPEGFDAADAEFKSWEEFSEWARGIVQPYPRTTPVVPTKLHTTTVVQPDIPRVEVVQGPEPEQKTYAQIWDDFHLALNKEGNPIINLTNVVRIFNCVADLKAMVWYDEFHNKILTRDAAGAEPRPWTSTDDISLTIQLQERFGLMRLTPAHTRDAVLHLAKLNQKNEPRDWMESLVWDGTPRIETFFHLYLGAKANDFTLAASKNWWVSMAARIFKPGCKVDTMVILEGEQGAKKSSTLEAIGGRWYKQLTEHFDSKDLYIGFQGKLIIEVAELDAFRKADTSTIKKIISNPSDHYRPLYERQNAEAPRRCVFVGTTNHGAYLEDETGARRFWPIECTAIDLDAIKRDRDQLFAEATHCFKLGHTWWEMPRQSTLEEQDKRFRGDAWDDAITRYLETGNVMQPFNEITTTQVATDALHIELGRVDQPITKRIGRALRKMGWIPTTLRNNQISPKPFRGWVRKPTM